MREIAREYGFVIALADKKLAKELAALTGSAQ
jgi:hypothetical protein